MNKERFIRKDGKISKKCQRYYWQIRNYIQKNNFNNSLKSLELAINLHEGDFRDLGEPYVVHPMEVTMYLILLNLHNAVLELNTSILDDTALAIKETNKQLDILLATALLHDTWEDCKVKFKDSKYKDKINDISSEVWKYVNILSKDKYNPEFSDKIYFKKISKHWITILIKIVDRVCNCSTIDIFGEERMKKYVKEIYDYFYPLIRTGKIYFPEFSRHFVITKNFLVSISETVAAVQGMVGIIKEEDPEKIFNFIRGYATGKGNMPNTSKALACAKEIYSGLKRKSGDDFIIHPLRVCSYLISLKINDDEICAAALVHEAIKKCEMKNNAIELITKWRLSPNVRDCIMLMASNRHYSLKLYYDILRENPKIFLLKLANKVNTCTGLIDMSSEEKQAYLDECYTYTYPSCDYVMEQNPQYTYAIKIMLFHIKSECSVTKNLLEKF